MRWWARAGTVCVAFSKNIVWLSFLLHYSKGVPLASFHFHYPASKESLSVPHSLYFPVFFLRSIYWKVMPFRISETSTLRLLISFTANNSLSIRSFYSYFSPTGTMGFLSSPLLSLKFLMYFLFSSMASFHPLPTIFHWQIYHIYLPIHQLMNIWVVYAFDYYEQI